MVNNMLSPGDFRGALSTMTGPGHGAICPAAIIPCAPGEKPSGPCPCQSVGFRPNPQKHAVYCKAQPSKELLERRLQVGQCLIYDGNQACPGWRIAPAGMCPQYKMAKSSVDRRVLVFLAVAAGVVGWFLLKK